MVNFNNYSDVIFDAFCLHTKQKDIVDRKQDILTKVSEHYNAGFGSILFIGFNPAILSNPGKEIYVAKVSDRVYRWLKEQNVHIQRYTNEDRTLTLLLHVTNI